MNIYLPIIPVENKMLTVGPQPYNVGCSDELCYSNLSISLKWLSSGAAGNFFWYF